MLTTGAASNAAGNNSPDQIKRSRRGGSTCAIQYAGRSSEAARVRWEFREGDQIYYSM